MGSAADEADAPQAVGAAAKHLLNARPPIELFHPAPRPPLGAIASLTLHPSASKKCPRLANGTG